MLKCQRPFKKYLQKQINALACYSILLKEVRCVYFQFPDDENNKWVSSNEFREGAYQLQDSLYGNFIKTGFMAYMATLQNEKKSKVNFSKSQQLLDAIKKTQIKYGGDTMISEDKISTEILYNRYDIFKKLFEYYMYASTLMFLLLIIQIFKDRSKYLNISVKTI